MTDAAGATEITIGALSRQIARRFRLAGLAAAEIEARALVRHVLDVDLTAFVFQTDRVVGAGEREAIEQLAERRLHHEPMGRILGVAEFRSLDLAVSAATLEPRPDTEVLVEAGLRFLGDRVWPRPPVIADLGTGTGAILIAILVECRAALGVAVDISEAALGAARANAERHAVSDRMGFVRANFADALAPGGFDLVVSNPPYIATNELDELAAEVRDFDPRIALDGGADGLLAYRALVAPARQCLKPDGALMVEIGHTQAHAVSGLFQDIDLKKISVLQDLGGRDRVVLGYRDAG